MKVRLVGINEEERTEAVTSGGLTYSSSQPQRKAIVARFAGCDGDMFTYLSLPAEMVGDTKVGDEFTIYLERVKK